jgi:hypothetical protein
VQYAGQLALKQHQNPDQAKGVLDFDHERGIVSIKLDEETWERPTDGNVGGAPTKPEIVGEKSLFDAIYEALPDDNKAGPSDRTYNGAFTKLWGSNDLPPKMDYVAIEANRGNAVTIVASNEQYSTVVGGAGAFMPKQWE